MLSPHLKSFGRVLFVSAALTGIVHADDRQVVPFGSINLSLQSTDDATLSGQEIRSNTSRFGIRGLGEWSDSTSWFYNVEWGYEASDDENSPSEDVVDRDQYVGLHTDWGQFIAGRSNTPLRNAQARIDLFNRLEGDMQRLMNGERRINNLVQYSSPRVFGGYDFKIAFTSGSGDASEGLHNGSGQSYAVSYVEGDLYASFAKDSNIQSAQSTTDRVAVQYNWGQWTFGALYNYHERLIATQLDTSDPQNPLPSREDFVDEQSFLLSAAYRSGNHIFKVQTGQGSEQALQGEVYGQFGIEQQQTTLGYDYWFSQNTARIYTFYSTNKSDDQVGSPVLDESWAAVGFEMLF